MLRTKIVCTIGPATSDPSTLAALVAGGMNVARINMSHGEMEDHRAVIRTLREVSEKSELPVAILADLQGPKIRVGKLEKPILLGEGDRLTFAPEDTVQPGELPTTYPDLARDVQAGERVLLDDGLLELECDAVRGDRIDFHVVRGGELKSNKGINIPSGVLSASSLTPKDLRDLDFALEERVEYIGLSFVRQASDVVDLKARVAGRALIVAKIEMALALQNIEDILEVCDMVMVARGDLGVELPFEAVPLAQKRIIQAANFNARPVITATQMLESMIENPRPTRAEVSDVANAVIDGTDAVMLSGETATGKYPLLALEAIVRIVREIEGSGVTESGPLYITDRSPRLRTGTTGREHAVASATVDALRNLHSPVALVITQSGFSARLISSHRPPVPIVAVTPNPRTYKQLAAVWGIYPILAKDVEFTYANLSGLGKSAILERSLGKEGDVIVVTSGYPVHESGSTNTLRLDKL